MANTFSTSAALSPLKIRLGGSLQDKVLYDTEDLKQPCPQFAEDPKSMFGFTEGCLIMARWDQLNAFFEQTGYEFCKCLKLSQELYCLRAYGNLFYLHQRQSYLWVKCT